MLGKLREKTTPTVRKIGVFLSFIPISANQFTFIAVIFAGLAAYFLSTKQLLWAFLLAVLASLWDLLDGSFARAKGQKSLFGNYWDAMVDKVVEALFYLGLAFLFPIHAFIAFAFTMLISYAKPRVALVIQADNHDWPAIGERVDRILLLLLGLFVAWLADYFNFFNSMQIIKMTLKAIIAITLLGFIQRILYAKKLIKKAKKEGKVLPYLLDKEDESNH